MKKVVKWTAYTLVLLFLGALVVCYFAYPEIVERLMEYINTPVAIAGISTTIGGLITIIVTKYIMSNTKFGRKELDTIKKDYAEFKENLCEQELKLTEKVAEYEQKYEDLKEECDNKVSIVYQQFEDAQKMLLDSLKTIPNKKVQEIVASYEEKFNEVKEEIIEKTINTNKFVDNKIAEIKKQYEEMYNELVAKVEAVLNEKAKND